MLLETLFIKIIYCEIVNSILMIGCHLWCTSGGTPISSLGFANFTAALQDWVRAWLTGLNTKQRVNTVWSIRIVYCIYT